MISLSNERPPPASAQNMACSTASQKVQKHIGFEPFFNAPKKVALKWMGQNGAPHIFLHLFSPLAWRARGTPRAHPPLFLKRARSSLVYLIFKCLKNNIRLNRLDPKLVWCKYWGEKGGWKERGRRGLPRRGSGDTSAASSALQPRVEHTPFFHAASKVLKTHGF